jgi:RimJ/RimL family protein N-acetyltransferase
VVSVNISSLEPHHTPAALALLRQIILESPHYSQAAKDSEIAALTAQLEAQPHTALVALEHGAVRGVLVWSGFEAGLLWLSWIVCAPEARGRGLGLELVQAFHEFAKQQGVHKTWCDSRIGNLASQKLLEKAGYKQAARLEKHWYGLDYFIWERYASS